jgi:addiction module HigA family antidote
VFASVSFSGKRYVEVMTTLDPIHPGEILEEEFIRPLGRSANALARAVDVPVTRISEIVRGRRLGRLFGTTPELWLGLQAEFDLRVARRASGKAINERVSPLKTSVGAMEVREAGGRYGAARSPTFDRRRRRKES